MGAILFKISDARIQCSYPAFNFMRRCLKISEVYAENATSIDEDTLNEEDKKFFLLVVVLEMKFS